MRRVLLLLSAAVTCEAFVGFAARRLLPMPRRVVPSRGFIQRPAVEARASLGEVKDTLAEVKDFAGWVLVPPPPPLESTVIEGASHFKTIGVPPDASYEEIKEQVKVLLDKYKGDSEKIAAIEDAKDQLMALRLRERVAGSAHADALVQDAGMRPSTTKDKLENAASKFAEIGPNVEYVSWRTILKMPEEEMLKAKQHRNSAKMFALLFIVPAILQPALINAFKLRAVALIVAVLHFNKRAPAKEDGSTSIVWSQYRNAMLVVSLGSFAGVAAAWCLPLISKLFLPNQLTFLGVVVGAFLAAAHFQHKGQPENALS